MATGDTAFFDGQHWVITLPFTEAGVIRLEQMLERANTDQPGKLFHGSLRALSRFMSHVEKDEAIFAQLGNSFERFNFVDRDDEPLFADSIEACAIPTQLRMDGKYHRVLVAVGKRMKEDDLTVIYYALLHYEWYLAKIATGHILKYGKLLDLDTDVRF